MSINKNIIKKFSRMNLLISGLFLFVVLAVFLLLFKAQTGYGEVSINKNGYTYSFLFDKQAEIFQEDALVSARGKDLKNKTVLGVNFLLPSLESQKVCEGGLYPVAFQAKTKYGEFPVCISANERIAGMNFNAEGTWHILYMVIPGFTSKLERYEAKLDRETVRVIAESITVSK